MMKIFLHLKEVDCGPKKKKMVGGETQSVKLHEKQCSLL